MANIPTHFEQIVKQWFPNATLQSVEALKGGVSAQVTRLTLLEAEVTRQVIVRQHGAIDLANNPHIAACEFALLQHLHRQGLPVSLPYGVDESGQLLPTPYIVLDYLEGDTQVDEPFSSFHIDQIAQALAQLHRLPTQFEHSCLTHYRERVNRHLKKPSALLNSVVDTPRLLQVIRSVWPFPQPNTDQILHGDYWQGNWIWRDNRLVGVIDWEDAAIGDPVADVAIARLELLWAFGHEAMQAFTQAYQAQMAYVDFSFLPYWDLVVAMRRITHIPVWKLESHLEQRLYTQLGEFVTAAYQALGQA